MSDEKKTDKSHAWVFDLKPGDKVWIAKEESIAKTARYTVDIYEETGPAEMESLEEVFVPYQMEVVNNWVLKSGDAESRLVTMKCADNIKSCAPCYTVKTEHRDLTSLLGSANSNIIPAMRIFKTKEECEEFCRDYILNWYTSERCDSILSALKEMSKRVQCIKDICDAAERN